jgi:hypothetical protein
MDSGEMDPFEFDDLIHHYKNAARELWKFCGSIGGDWERAARTLDYLPPARRGSARTGGGRR